MSKEPLRFYLIDQRTKERFRFTLIELRAFVKSIPQSRIASIKVQVEGRAEWLSLANFNTAAPPRRDLEISVVDDTSADEETTVIELRQKVENPPPVSDDMRGKNERRLSPRVQIRRRVILVANDSVYRTFTVDASVDGLRLEHPVPKQLDGRVVDCYLSSQDLLTGLFFRAVLVAGGSESVRLRFVEQDAKNKSILGIWLSSLHKKSA